MGMTLRVGLNLRDIVVGQRYVRSYTDDTSAVERGANDARNLRAVRPSQGKRDDRIGRASIRFRFRPKTTVKHEVPQIRVVRSDSVIDDCDHDLRRACRDCPGLIGVDAAYVPLPREVEVVMAGTIGVGIGGNRARRWACHGIRFSQRRIWELSSHVFADRLDQSGSAQGVRKRRRIRDGDCDSYLGEGPRQRPSGCLNQGSGPGRNLGAAKHHNKSLSSISGLCGRGLWKAGKHEQPDEEGHASDDNCAHGARNLRVLRLYGTLMPCGGTSEDAAGDRPRSEVRANLPPRSLEDWTGGSIPMRVVTL